MDKDRLHIVLAEDDEDDRAFFKEAIDDVRINTKLDIVNDGVQLMDYLANANGSIPDVVFLDLNMPRKGGIECLEEIRANQKLKDISVAIYSTSSAEQDIEQTFLKGANVYIRKPNDFEKLKKAIAQVLSINWQYHTSRLNRENFILVV